MQGISKSKHEHLMGALQHLEELLFSKEGLKVKRDEVLQEDAADFQQVLRDAIQAREELQQLYVNYNLTLEDLALIISKYEKLYSHLRTDFVSKRLKELKREMPITDEQFKLLKEGIHTAYGT
ncbi:MAG: hypothetical protein EOP54_25555 [Sphingobacteriales bacterium]|nr:MAG: hypothetical protein EOP54_25555 [Sphingobacteriales bacterium]